GANGRPTGGVVGPAGGTAGDDAAVWSSQDSAGTWSKSSFVATALDASGACSSPPAFAAALRRYPPAAALPVVSEAVQAPAPASRITADYGCLKASVTQGSPASVAMWRPWERPIR